MTDWTEIVERKARKTQEGTPYVETTYADGYVAERFFRTPADAYRFVNETP